MKCASCGDKILTEWVEALGRVWHPEHFICKYCRRPIHGGFVDDCGLPAHRDCWEERNAPKCRQCGTTIVGKYSISLWGENSCLKCHGGGSCIHCQGATRSRDIDDQLACPTCRDLAVTDDSAATKHLRAVSQWINDLGVLGAVPRVPLELYSPERMRTDFDVDEKTLGIARKTLTESCGRKTVRSDGIVVVRGLPWPIFEKVVAHEFGHVWVAANGILDLSKRDEEGFCELLSFLWLTERGSLAKEALREGISGSKDPIYGDGFREIYHLYAKYGLRHVIDTLRKPMHNDMAKKPAWGMKWPGSKI